MGNRGRVLSRGAWSESELRLLADIYPECHTADVAAWLGRRITQVYNMAGVRGIRKSVAYLASDTAARIQRGKQHPAMIASRLQPGHTPWNKGKRGVNGTSPTRFQKGSIPQTWRPVGTVIVQAAGYVIRKVSDTGNRRNDWVLVHRQVWEKARGSVPDGHVVIFKPGMKTSNPDRITAEILECIDRAELARRNHPRLRDPELGRLIQLKGAIARQVNRITREAQAA